MSTLKHVTRTWIHSSVASLAIAMAYGTPLIAQTTEPAPPAADAPGTAEGSEIIVLGTQIRGARVTGALPVNVVGTEQIQAVAAVSGADLFRSIPQLGGVTFNEQVLSGGSANAARGDVSTISLRGLGQGNTLILINGRRTVLHPTSQAITGVVDSGVPTFGYNANAIPVGGIERVEVLRDGAAALYGSDAVAGVVNNVLQNDFKGLRIDSQYGFAEGTNLKEWQANALFGTSFGGGRGNISIFAGYTQKTKLYLSDQDYTANADRRSYVAGTSFANVAAFNGTSTSAPWGTFRASGSGIITSNGVPLTNASRQFHTQPSTQVGCRTATSTPGVCFDDGVGTTEMASVDSNLRFNAPQTFSGLTTQPSVKRLNLFTFLNYELTDTLSFFGEAGFYHGKTNATTSSGGSLTNIPITVAANAYWNPLGPVGSPNRLPGLNIPTTGLPVTISSHNYVDAGPRNVEVINYQYRFLAGLKGELGSWRWESAALYSWATAQDTSDGISSTLLQAAINKTTPDAYNPFNGGDPLNPSIGDLALNNQATIDSFKIKATRSTRTSLFLADFKISNANLLTLWAGNTVGIAAGIEFRKETYNDDRSKYQGGILGVDNTYTDAVTGIFYGSDLVGASPSPDVHGERNVKSAYAEIGVGLVNRDMGIPLVRALDLQLAGRYESYSDVGDVAKPKIAGSWEILEGVKARASWSQGFRAPNLEVINTSSLDRVNGGIDYVLCEADLRAGRISNFSQCARNISVLRRSGGNKNLKPEESTSWSFGAVIEPPLPSEWGHVTFTVDRWRIRQENVVGLLDYQNGLNLDYLLRVEGSSNPNVVRAAPTADDIAAVAGTGLQPVGQLLYVVANFENLLPVTVQGVDFQLDYRLRDTPIGSFSFSVNASKLISYYVDVPADVQAVIDARAAGSINQGVPIQGGGDVVGRDGQPRWRRSATFNWMMGGLTLGAFTQFIDDVYENAVRDAANNPWVVKSQTTWNFYAKYKFDETSRWLKNTTFQIGVRNAFDKDPPLASSGYLSSLYQPQGRYWYTGLSKSF
ncbi:MULTISPECIES: TonB-dependent receptor domain-containing protein [unclassified Sphingobium]|uniref:TonB-dependent receptor domain-containing protein n=1 Tax=unclassified Sphingobium TaxID=2611147 RepID=UPI0022253EA5|nr:MULTISPECIES: TonB-dependent receptor [unclassified Sphingobium]MCW2413328.1 outer membrane receptor protein involved in Fe transport [Sphingobium sp. B8D3D]MCW2414373.1 outer membrane receptor protein involved in Fe transport [Sphingobium sp. B8D3A]